MSKRNVRERMARTGESYQKALVAMRKEWAEKRAELEAKKDAPVAPEQPPAETK
jgi:hypothetical protein